MKKSLTIVSLQFHSISTLELPPWWKQNNAPIYTDMKPYYSKIHKVDGELSFKDVFISTQWRSSKKHFEPQKASF